MAGIAGICLLVGAKPAAAAILYSTSFGNPPFAPGGSWAGVDGWLASDPTSGAIAVTTDGGAVYIGGPTPPAASDYAGAGRPFNLDPVAMGLPIVRITSRLGIQDSTNNHFDAFTIPIFDQAGHYLGSFLLDNGSQKFGYDNGSGFQEFPTMFPESTYFTIRLTINLSTNQISADVIKDDGTVISIFANLTFSTMGAALNLGELDFSWLINTVGSPGNNALLIDSLTVEAFPNPSLVLAKTGVQRTRKNSYILRGGQAPTDNVQIQWRTKEHKKWTAVTGAPTQWLIKLKHLQPGHNIVQLRMLDVLGQPINQENVTVLWK